LEFVGADRSKNERQPFRNGHKGAPEAFGGLKRRILVSNLVRKRPSLPVKDGREMHSALAHTLHLSLGQAAVAVGNRGNFNSRLHGTTV
jgi:hypothetical protein